MQRAIEPPLALILVAGRERHSVPRIDETTAVSASRDCLTVSIAATQVWVNFGLDVEEMGLPELARADLQTDGLVSVLDIEGREYEAAPVPKGAARIIVYGNAPTDPDHLVIQVIPLDK